MTLAPPVGEFFIRPTAVMRGDAKRSEKVIGGNCRKK